jgi:LacI family transcriptional regulator
MTKLTLDEIARRAGVSRTTASRVVNNRPNVRAEVRERVMRVVEATGYRPNPVARSLATQRSEVIGLVLPRRSDALFTDPYFPRLIQGLAQGCNQHDHTLALFLLQSQEDETKLYPKLSNRGLLDGLVFQVGKIGEALINKLLADEMPLVIAGRPANVDEISYVDVDNVAGAYAATRHLLRLGYQRVGTITGALNTTAGLDRQQGYLQALDAEGRRPDPDLISEGDFTEAGGYAAMRRLLPHAPDAVFAASDTMAIGAMRAAREAELAIPEDVAFVGFDDLPPADQVQPPLTTVRQPIRRFGIKAVEILLDIIENGPEPPRHVVFSTELIVRASCGARRHAPQATDALASTS